MMLACLKELESNNSTLIARSSVRLRAPPNGYLTAIYNANSADADADADADVCGMRNAECGMRNAAYGLGHLECRSIAWHSGEKG